MSGLVLVGPLAAIGGDSRRMPGAMRAEGDLVERQGEWSDRHLESDFASPSESLPSTSESFPKLSASIDVRWTEPAEVEGSAPGREPGADGLFWTELAKLHSRSRAFPREDLLTQSADKFPATADPPIVCRKASRLSPVNFEAIRNDLDSLQFQDVSFIGSVIDTQCRHVSFLIDQILTENVSLQRFTADIGRTSSRVQRLEELLTVSTALQCELTRVAMQAQQGVQNARLLQSTRSSVSRLSLADMTGSIPRSMLSPNDNTLRPSLTECPDDVFADGEFEDSMEVFSSIGDSQFEINDSADFDSRSSSFLGSLLQYNVTKINRFNRNTKRVFEIDTKQHSLAICKPTSCTGGFTGDFNAREASIPLEGDKDDILLSNMTILDVQIIHSKPSSTEIHIQYLSQTMTRSKLFRGLMETSHQREQFYRELCLHVLVQKPRRCISHSSKIALARGTGTMAPSFQNQPGSGSMPIEVNRPVPKFQEKQHAYSHNVLLSSSFSHSNPKPILHCPEGHSVAIPFAAIAERWHRNWALHKFTNSWTRGKKVDPQRKTHPELVPFDVLPMSSQLSKVALVQGTCNAMRVLGYDIVETGNQLHRPVITEHAMNRLIDLLAQNVHDIWVQSMSRESWRFGVGLDEKHKRHPKMVPFSCLSDGDRNSYRATAAQIFQSVIELGFVIEPVHVEHSVSAAQPRCFLTRPTNSFRGSVV